MCEGGSLLMKTFWPSEGGTPGAAMGLSFEGRRKLRSGGGAPYYSRGEGKTGIVRAYRMDPRGVGADTMHVTGRKKGIAN